MDPRANVADMVEDLEVNIDELTTTLSPLLDTPLHTTASTLPLLDKAKLYVLSAYAIESLLFSTLQASGANAKEHAVFPELARLKGYFSKIKDVETAGQNPKTRLDKEAAARFIKHGLAGNERYDLARAERMAKEKARAALKARQMHIKFDDKDAGTTSAATAANPPPASAKDSKKRAAEQSSDEDSDDIEPENNDNKDKPQQEPPATTTTTTATPLKSSHKESKRDRKRRNKSPTETDPQDPTDPKAKRPKKKKRKFPLEDERKNPQTPDPTTEESVLPSRPSAQGDGKRHKEHQAPASHTDVFSSLLDGSFGERQKKVAEGHVYGGSGSGKGKGKGNRR